MSRFMLFALSFSTTLALCVGAGHAASSLSAALAEHFRPSRMDLQNSAGEGRIVQQGTVLALQADAVPANKLRVVQINTKSSTALLAGTDARRVLHSNPRQFCASRSGTAGALSAASRVRGVQE